MLRRFTTAVTAILLTAGVARAQGNEANRFSREGIIAARAKDWNKAVDSFRRAVQADPNNKGSIDNLAIALVQRASAELNSKNVDAAINDLNESLKVKADDNLPAHRSRAYAFLLKNDWNNALGDYDVVVSEAKDDPEVHERRAYIFMQLRQFDKAIQDYSESIRLKPNDARFYELRAYAYQTMGNNKAALDDTNKVLQFDSNNAAAQQRKHYLEAKLNPGPTPVITPSGPIANPNARPATSPGVQSPIPRPTQGP